MKRNQNASVVLSLLVMALAVSLSGCPAVAGVFTDERGLATQMDDESISADVKSAIMDKGGFGQAVDVNVYSFDGHVFLVGEARDDVRQAAVEKARQVRGVTQVTTKWFPSGSSRMASDATLEAQVDAALLGAKGVPSTNISVDVWDRHVVLLGIVAEASQKSAAVKAAKGVSGVKSVTDYIIVSR